LAFVDSVAGVADMQDLGADEMLGAALASVGLGLGRRLEHDRAIGVAVAACDMDQSRMLGVGPMPFDAVSRGRRSGKRQRNRRSDGCLGHQSESFAVGPK